jgi:hypothetical protein
VPSEGPRGHELAQLVSNHIFLNVDWHVPPPVVDRNRMAYHMWEDRRSARPRADNALLANLIHPFDFAQKLRINERNRPLQR